MLRRNDLSQLTISSLKKLLKKEIMLTSICISGIIVLKVIIINGLMRLAS